MSAASHSIQPHSAGNDLDALLVRMSRRCYPETIPVLASYWLKTVYDSGRTRDWWKDLDSCVAHALKEETLGVPAVEALREIQAWIHQMGFHCDTARGDVPKRITPFRPDPRPEYLASYVYRLLNEWLWQEVSWLLVNERESFPAADGGIPVLAVGKALERLLVRESLSPAGLEMLLQPQLLATRWTYPAEMEILQDVVLSLLGRTSSPGLPVMPAQLLAVAEGSPFPADYADCVRRASLVHRYGKEEIHVPIGAQSALELLKGARVRIGSVVVTTDGRWWESENLESGGEHRVVYRPAGRLHIDYSSEHARLALPGADRQVSWAGTVRLPGPFELFGREWRVSSWELSGERAWLHLTFSRTLAVNALLPAPGSNVRRSRPAAVDIAWAAMGNALAAAVELKSREPIEELRRSQFVPLGRAVFALSETLRSAHVPSPETLETQLKAIRYHEAEIIPEYGLIPWRILPQAVRTGISRRCSLPPLAGLLVEVFEFPREAPADAHAPFRAA